MKEIYFLCLRHRAKKDDARQAGRICYKHEKRNFESWHLLNKSLRKKTYGCIQERVSVKRLKATS